jgi:C4-dicarboxylate transporter, DctQ subunit
LSRLLHSVQAFFKMVTVLENILCATGLFLTTFMTFFQVLNRYWLRYEIIWLNDLSLFVFIFFMFFAIPLTTREGQHTGVDVFVKTVFENRPLGRAGFNAFLKVVSIGTIVVFMIPAWAFALRAAKYPQYATLVRWFNTSWLMQSLFFCMSLCLLHLVYNLACDMAEIRRLRNAGEGR